MLTEKLFECLRPFVEVKNPGGAGNEETAAWETRMHHEADDLKFESFGVKQLHTIGTVCNTKATSFFKQSWILVKVEGEGHGRERRVGHDWCTCVYLLVPTPFLTRIESIFIERTGRKHDFDAWP